MFPPDLVLRLETFCFLHPRSSLRSRCGADKLGRFAVSRFDMRNRRAICLPWKICLTGARFSRLGALLFGLIGGIIAWIPPGMMSVAGVLLVLNFLQIHEERLEETDDDRSMAQLSRRWTGR